MYTLIKFLGQVSPLNTITALTAELLSIVKDKLT